MTQKGCDDPACLPNGCIRVQPGVDSETARLYRSMSVEALTCLRVAFTLDRANATHDLTRQFCTNRIDLIDRILLEGAHELRG